MSGLLVVLAFRLEADWRERMELTLVLYALKPDSSWYSST